MARAKMISLKISLEDSGHISIEYDKVDADQLKRAFDAKLPNYQNSDMIVSYVRYIEKNLSELLQNGEAMHNLRDVKS